MAAVYPQPRSLFNKVGSKSGSAESLKMLRCFSAPPYFLELLLSDVEAVLISGKLFCYHIALV